ncbi:hypothetical protein H0A66_10450 [Alcaligenaceae bacterium]|nr:hypothetical protein [Alcaligenaceae bacterium]
MTQAFINIGRKDRAHLRARPHSRFDNTMEVQVIDSKGILRVMTCVFLEKNDKGEQDYGIGLMTLYSQNPSTTKFDESWAVGVIVRSLTTSHAVRLCTE